MHTYTAVLMTDIRPRLQLRTADLMTDIAPRHYNLFTNCIYYQNISDHLQHLPYYKLASLKHYRKLTVD